MFYSCSVVAIVFNVYVNRSRPGDGWKSHGTAFAKYVTLSFSDVSLDVSNRMPLPGGSPTRLFENPFRSRRTDLLKFYFSRGIIKKLIFYVCYSFRFNVNVQKCNRSSDFQQIRFGSNTVYNNYDIVTEYNNNNTERIFDLCDNNNNNIIIVQ